MIEVSTDLVRVEDGQLLVHWTVLVLVALFYFLLVAAATKPR